MSVPSPCIHVCQLNVRRVCVGCWRTIDEIVAWGRMSDAQKLQVLSELPARREPQERS